MCRKLLRLLHGRLQCASAFFTTRTHAIPGFWRRCDFCAPAPDEPDLVCPCVTIPRKLAQTDPYWATFRIHGEPLYGYKLKDNPKTSLSRKHSDHKILILRPKPCARSKKALNYPKPQPQPPSTPPKKNILNTPTSLASRKPDYLLQGQLQANEQMTELISASCPRI